MRFGTTFSSFRINQLQLPLKDAVDELLRFDFDTVRIGSYWNEYESIQNEYDYTSLEYIVDQCEKRDQKIILTVGAKSPRWPEFHIPDWALSTMQEQSGIKTLFRSPIAHISSDILQSVEHIIRHFKKYDCIEGWQVENEPLDPSGPDRWRIPHRLLEQEIEVVKSIDTRPIIVNVWGNTLSRRKLLSRIPAIADKIGIDLYYTVPGFRNGHYTDSVDSDTSINRQLKKVGKPVLITELQAEPWKHSPDADESLSMTPELLRENVSRVVKDIDAECILLWGFEYWYYKKVKKGDSSFSKVVEKLLKMR